MVRIPRVIRIALSCLPALLAYSMPACAFDWLPVAPEDVKTTSEPAAPNAPAIYLYRQVDRNDDQSDELVYNRIKILTDEGRKYANVEIAYDRGQETINYIEARTFKPNGTIVPFDGTVYDKELLKARGAHYQAKTFTLPDVLVGSIVEYHYRRMMPPQYAFNSRWVLSDSLFTRYAKFSLTPTPDLTLRWSWPLGLPDGSSAPVRKGGRIVLEAHNVAALVEEEYQPPDDELTYRVDFIYSNEDDFEKVPDAYWKSFGKQRWRKVDNFLDEDRAMKKAVAQIVAPDDSAEAKLKKIYARVQQLRNLSYERRRTEQETDREKLRDNHDVSDVWDHGYGDGEELTWLFVALVRAAGLPAEPVLVSTRDKTFFQPALMNPYALNTNVAEVTYSGNLLYVDPGAAFTPFGMLPWYEAGVTGLRLEKDGGKWVTTPVAKAPQSRIERKAAFQLTAQGSVEGTLTVTYWGLQGLDWRQNEHNEDATERKRALEQEIKDQIPVGSDVDLTSSPDWDSSAPSLTAEFNVSIPGWALAAGSRRLLPIAPFDATARRTFTHSTRLHSLYFAFPTESDDDIVIKLPPQLQVSSLPTAVTENMTSLEYNLLAENADGALHLRRQLINRTLLIKAEGYPAVRDFFQKVRTSDENQIVLVPATAAAAAAPAAPAVKH